jgi:hypothetical protein
MKKVIVICLLLLLTDCKDHKIKLLREKLIGNWEHGYGNLDCSNALVSITETTWIENFHCSERLVPVNHGYFTQICSIEFVDGNTIRIFDCERNINNTLHSAILEGTWDIVFNSVSEFCRTNYNNNGFTISDCGGHSSYVKY